MTLLITQKPVVVINKAIKEFLYGLVAFGIASLFALIPTWIPENYAWTIPLIMVILHSFMKSIKPYLPKEFDKYEPFYKKIIEFISKYLGSWINSIKDKHLDIP